MKTIVSKTGIEVLYPCTVHLLNNGAVIECEYKSDNVGQDLMDYICDYINLKETDYWGLKFVDTFEQRHWLDLNKLIRTQVKNSCPVHFQFRVKVYPPEPYKIADKEAKDQIFMQLRFDLVNGKLGCGPSDSPLLMGLLLQYTYGDYNDNVHFGNYVKDKIILNQSFSTEMKAIEMHKIHLKGLTLDQSQDLFLRLACQLKTYGVDPYLIENVKSDKLTLWINYKGVATYNDSNNEDFFDWMTINKISHEETKLDIHLVTDDVVTYFCLTKGECNYIYNGAVSHLVYFTTSGCQSTVGVIGKDTDDESVEFIENGKKSETKNALFQINNKKLSMLYSFYSFFICRYIIILIIITGTIVNVFGLFNYDLIEIFTKIVTVENIQNNLEFLISNFRNLKIFKNFK